MKIENNSIPLKDIPLLSAERKNDGLSPKVVFEKVNNKKAESTKKIVIVELIMVIIIVIGILIIFVPKKPEETLIDYEEAEKIVDPIVTKENHDLLNKMSNNIDKLIPICKNISFQEINVTFGELPENLDFLFNSTNISLQIARQDLELYINQYANTSEEINNMTKKVSEIMIKITPYLIEYKNEIDNLTKQFEKNIQNLAMPLLNHTLNSSKLRNMGVDGLRTEYMNLTLDLNKLYNDVFKDMEEESINIVDEIKGIPEKIETIKNQVIYTFSSGENILHSITESTLHKKLIELKENFAAFHDNLNVIKKELNSMKVEITKFAESLGKKESNFLKNLMSLVSQMGKSTINLVPVILDFFDIDLNDIDFDKVGKPSINYVKIIGAIAIYAIEYWINNMKGIVKIEAITSLDLLFIVDITGSMSPYLRNVKDNIINIINGIIKECPGIDINLGFIGYEDFYEYYYEVDFTKDHNYIKNYINKLDVEGGGSYYPDEDVALALELTLKKSWKSNAKLAAFIADAPGHGEKYGGHNTSDSDPKRRDIGEMIGEMAEDGISLFCMKITEKTDLMYKVFNEIYNEKKNNNTLFAIADGNDNSFTDLIVNYSIQVYYEQRKRNEEEEGCLLSKKAAIDVLKSEYGIDNNNPDENLRFILGKCSPVLLVPGVYSTKLKVEFNCKGIAKEEKDTTLKNIRLYCGFDVCSDETKTSEEHPLLFSLLDMAFGIEILNKYKHGACLGHIATYFQNENECPKVGKKSVCHYSKYVKVGFYGGTSDTLDESRCGIEGISNVVQTGDLLIDAILSTFAAKAADSFYTISKNLIHQKYKEGFSLAALPNDFRRFLASNNFATQVFESQINRLYNNTGKPVVIIAHSYGTLLTLTNLLKFENDKEFMKKIKKFIAMAPPFAGSSKLLDVFLHTTKDFDSNMANYPNFGQYLLYKSLPTIMELRPQPMAAKIFTDSEYEELGNALKERIEIERDCKNKNCDTSLIESKSENFDKIFKGYFPSLLDSECEYESFDHIIGYNEETFNRKCFTNIYNVGDCPTIITKSVNPTKTNFEKDKYCKQFGKKYFYQGECVNKERNCLDEMYYSNKCPNVYSNTKALNFLLERFNTIFSSKFGKIDKNYFDNHEIIKEGVKNSIEHQKKIDLIKELPIPPVDTELLYATFYPTTATLILDDNDFTKEGEFFDKGGDDTVPAWSSLLTGLKWIYDKKKNNLNQNIKLIEYCSRLAQPGKYRYDANKKQNFGAISCVCLNKEDNLYDKEIKECSHAGMLHDENLIKYLYSVINDPKDKIIHTTSKKDAAKRYDKYYDYTGECNKNIYDILETAK